MIILCALSILTLILAETTSATMGNHGWNQMQNDGALVQMSANNAPILPPMRNTPHCEPDVSTINKRSAQAIDSFPNLNQYFLNEESSDVKLVVNGTKLPAHKFVLSAKSPKFAELFKSDPLKEEFEIDINSEEVFKGLLKYFYTEKYEMPAENDYSSAFEVYKVAKDFGLEAVQIQIERTLAKNLFLRNYIEIYKFAKQHQMNELLRLWHHFVFQNSQPIVSEELYLNETLDVTEQILMALNVPQSYVILKIKHLVDVNKDLDYKHFSRLVRIERCNFDDLVMLYEMQVFDRNMLFDDLVKRVKVLSATCGHINVQRRWIIN